MNAQYILNAFAEEINTAWTKNYKAEIKNEVLVVYYNNEPNWVECAYLNSRLEASGIDEDAIGQLEYMVQRCNQNYTRLDTRTY